MEGEIMERATGTAGVTGMAGAATGTPGVTAMETEVEEVLTEPETETEEELTETETETETEEELTEPEIETGMEIAIVQPTTSSFYALKVFSFLFGVLFAMQLRPTLEVEVFWKPESILYSTRITHCRICLHTELLNLFETVFSSALATLSYLCYTQTLGNSVESIYERISNNLLFAISALRNLFLWAYLIPWIHAFCRNWLYSCWKLISLFKRENIYEEIDIKLFVLLQSFLVVQILIGSEVMISAYKIWHELTIRNNIFFPSAESFIANGANDVDLYDCNNGDDGGNRDNDEENERWQRLQQLFKNK